MKTQKESIKVSKKLASTFNTLKFFALNKEGTVEDVAAFIGKDYTTALRIARKLLRADAIKLERLEKTKGKEKRIYRITLYGLFAFMEIDRETATSKFEEIAEAHRDKLLTFKKLEYFKRKDLAGLIRERFFESLRLWAMSRRSMLYFFSTMQGEPSFPKLDSDQNTAKATDASILGIFYMIEPVEHVKQVVGEKWAELMKLFQAIEDDYELRMFRDDILSRFEREHREALKALNQWEKLCRESLTLTD